MTEIGQALSGALLASAGLWAAWCIGVRLLPRADPSVRACGAAVAWLWLATALFIALSAFAGFRRAIALPLWCAAAIGAHLIARRTGDPWIEFQRCMSALGALVVRLARQPVAVVLAIAVLVFGAHLARGIFAPTLAWDDLTYHLFRPARWLQAGGFAIEPAPNAWGYSEYFPPIGDIVWAWAMLPVNGDALLVFANLLICATMAASLYAAARLIGASETTSVLAAATLVMSPSVVHYVPSGYVDPLTVALFSLSVLFAGRAVVHGSPVDAVLLAAVLGLAAGVKVSNLAFAGPGAIVVVTAVFRANLTPRERLVTAAVCLCAGTISAPFYWRAWWDMGSPTYPVPLDIGESSIFTGNFWQQQIFAGPVEGRNDSNGFLFRHLFVPTRAVFEQVGQFINPGPGILLLALPAIPGAAAWFRSRRHRVIWVYVMAAGFLVTWSALQPGAVNLRSTVLASSFGRFLGVPVSALVLCAAAGHSRWTPRILAVALALNCLLSIPLGWSAADGTALRAFAMRVVPLLAVGGAAAVTIWKLKAPLLGLLVTVLAVAGSIAFAAPVRAALRYDYFRDAAAGKAFSVNRDVALLTQNWPAWRQMDQAAPAAVAVAAGWPGMTPFGARYPFLGSRLQNRVSYVPITATAEVFDTPSRFAHPDEGDFNAWLQRLVRANITHLVVLTPAIEGVWARDHPDVFAPEPAGEVEIYRVNQSAASGRVRAGSPSGR